MEKSSLSEQTIQDKKFLNALAEAFRLQEAILNATSLAIGSVTPEGIITSFNKAAEELFGYSGEEVIGKSGPLLFTDLHEVIERANKYTKRTGEKIGPLFDLFIIEAREGKTYRDEWTFVRKDGSRFPASLSVSALRDERGEIFGYVGIVTDLTEIKKISARAKESEDKFRLLAENIPGAIYLCHYEDPYPVLYLNEQVEKITGYPAKDFLSGDLNIIKLYHPDDAEMINRHVTEALNERRSYRLIYRIRHKSGEWRWVDEAGTGVYNEDGQLTMLEGFLRDITEEKKVEEKLKKIAEENHQIFNNPVNLNVIAGFDGYFKRVSPTWTTVLGWSEQDLLETPYFNFVHPDDLEPTYEAASYISLGNNLFTFENRYRCKDGSYRWLLWGSASDLRNKLVYASAIDITERKKSEEKLLNSKKNLESIAFKLQEQNRQLDEFAHIISHNLRSPVGNIQALIKLLDDNSKIEDYKVIFDKIKNVAKNLGETMNDLMDTLKVKTEAIDRVELRFKDILDKVVQSLEGELIIAEASVTYDFNNAPIVLYSKAYLESIFQNLLSNSLKYRSPERKAKIHFESRVNKNRVELCVTDNGQGIDLEKFGDKLFGLHRTFHIHEQARGVGLFLIKTQIESMGGTISVQSTVNEGTTFIIHF